MLKPENKIQKIILKIKNGSSKLKCSCFHLLHERHCLLIWDLQVNSHETIKTVFAFPMPPLSCLVFRIDTGD